MSFDPFRNLEIKVSLPAQAWKLFIDILLITSIILLSRDYFEKPLSIFNAIMLLGLTIISIILLCDIQLRIRSLFTAGQPSIFIGPAGFLDKRIFNEPIKWNQFDRIEIIRSGRVYLITIATNENRRLTDNYLNYMLPWIKLREPRFFLYPIGGLKMKVEEFDEHLMSYHYYWTNSDIKDDLGFKRTFFDLHERHTNAEPGVTWETLASTSSSTIDQRTAAKKQQE